MFPSSPHRRRDFRNVAKVVTAETMPHASWQRLRENLGYILHLAAFYLRRGTAGGRARAMAVKAVRLAVNSSGGAAASTIVAT